MVRKLLTFSLLIGLTLSLHFSALGQAAPVIVQAESGSLGSDFISGEESGVQFIKSQTTGAGQSPGTEARVATYRVTFSVFGTYDLYARVRVGVGGFDDDSFFYSNGFGVKSATSSVDWITVNGLSTFGFSEPNDVVTGAGTAGNEVWKWIKLSAFDGGEAPISFTVPAGNLTQTFSIGAREDGLELDKFAFVTGGSSITVAELDAGSTTSAPPEYPPIAYGKHKFLGNIYSSSQAHHFARYWNQVVPENAGKWGSVEATRNVMNWTELDASYALAKQNGFPFRMHVLLWGNQQPSWIETLPASEQLAEIREWFSLVAARYPDIDFIEVVNEPLNDPPSQAGNGGGNYIGALGGTGTSGYDWILTSFRLAREFFPTTKLMINEYNIVNNTNNTNRYLQIINLLKGQNLIDAIGVQAHAFSTTAASSTITANLNALGATGIPIYVTEMDIDGPTDQKQLEDYQRIFPLFWEHPAVQGVTLWGYRPGLWRDTQGAYLITANGTERPALTWLRNYVSTTVTSVSSDRAEAQVTVYPNPVTNRKIIVAGAERQSKIQVFSANGSLVKEVQVSDQTQVEIDLNVPAGFYILRFTQKDVSFSKRIVVQ